jgi:hypothetical protein
VNSLVDELANVSAKERALLDQCKDFLSTVAAMQVIVLFCSHCIIPGTWQQLFPQPRPPAAMAVRVAAIPNKPKKK